MKGPDVSLFVVIAVLVGSVSGDVRSQRHLGTRSERDHHASHHSGHGDHSGHGGRADPHSHRDHRQSSGHHQNAGRSTDMRVTEQQNRNQRHNRTGQNHHNHNSHGHSEWYYGDNSQHARGYGQTTGRNTLNGRNHQGHHPGPSGRTSSEHPRSHGGNQRSEMSPHTGHGHAREHNSRDREHGPRTSDHSHGRVTPSSVTTSKPNVKNINRTANLTQEAQEAALGEFSEIRFPLITAPQRNCPDGQKRDRANVCRAIF